MSNSGQERPLQSVFNVQETERQTDRERERDPWCPCRRSRRPPIISHEEGRTNARRDGVTE